MTGVVETVSLGLAVVPIVISVAEHYSAASSALKRYKQFSSETRRLSIFVKTQRTKFHCEIRSLLSHCVSWEQAELLLDDTDNERWKDQGLEACFAEMLGNTREPFVELVDEIIAELSVMEARSKAFEEVAQLAKKVGAVSSAC